MMPKLFCDWMIDAKLGVRCGVDAQQAVVTKREHGETVTALCEDHVRPWCVRNDVTLDELLGIKGDAE